MAREISRDNFFISKSAMNPLDINNDMVEMSTLEIYPRLKGKTVVMYAMTFSSRTFFSQNRIYFLFFFFN